MAQRRPYAAVLVMLAAVEAEAVVGLAAEPEAVKLEVEGPAAERLRGTE